jgi:hypothetical protein
MATATAEAVRALTHTTLAGTGYADAADLDQTIGELSRAAWMLPQVLEQASAWLHREHTQAPIGHDASSDPRFVDLAVARCQEELGNPREAAGVLAATLATVRDLTTHLTGGLS